MSNSNDNPSPDPRPGERHPPVPRRVPPVNVGTLNYQSTKAPPTGGGRVGLHFLLGFLTPFAYGAVAGVLMVLVNPSPAVIGAVLWLLFAGFVVMVALVWLRTGWRGYVPGVLTATLALPLLAVATIAVLCSM